MVVIGYQCFTEGWKCINIGNIIAKNRWTVKLSDDVRIAASSSDQATRTEQNRTEYIRTEYILNPINGPMLPYANILWDAYLQNNT